jgi:16S rRNA processing protein RimM
VSYLLVGRIRKPQGLRGHVTIELLTDTPDAIFAPGGRVFAGTAEGDLARDPADPKNPESRYALIIETVSPFKDGIVVKFKEIPDRTEAERWRHRYLLVPKDEVAPLADDEVFIHDLIGMAVQSTDGTNLGNVIGTYDLPQGLTLDVETKRGSVLVPYHPEHVIEVDLDTRVVTVDTTSGLFD